jgi:hypothetical protein
VELAGASSSPHIRHPAIANAAPFLFELFQRLPLIIPNTLNLSLSSSAIPK